MALELIEIIDPAATLIEVIDPAATVLESMEGPSTIIEVRDVGLPGARQVVTKGVVFLEPGAAEDVTLFYTAEELTILRLSVMVLGPGSSVSFSVFYGPDRDTGTEIITGGSTIAADPAGSVIEDFDEPVIPADSWVWLEINSTSGSVYEFHASLSH